MEFKVRMMRTVSFETDIVIHAPSEADARRMAMDKARFLIWEHRNSAEYEVLTIKKKDPDNPDPQETSSDLMPIS